jgi:hypothetical protein
LPKKAGSPPSIFPSPLPFIANGWHKVVLCGVSDLAEIASLRAGQTNVEIAGIYDPHSECTRFIGKEVWRDLNHAGPFDACVLTDLQAPAASYERLTAIVERRRVVVPAILRLE